MVHTYNTIEIKKYAYIAAWLKYTRITDLILSYCQINRPLLQALFVIASCKPTQHNIQNFAECISKYHHDGFELQEGRQHDPHETLQAIMKGVNEEHSNATTYEPTLAWATQSIQTKVTSCNTCKYSNHTPQQESTLWGPPDPRIELAYHLNDPDEQSWTGYTRPKHTHKGSQQLLINKTSNLLIITYKKRRLHPITGEYVYTTHAPNTPLRLQVRQRETDTVKTYTLQQTIAHIHGENYKHYLTYIRDPNTNDVYKLNDTHKTLLKHQSNGKPHPEFLNRFTVILAYTADDEEQPPALQVAQHNHDAAATHHRTHAKHNIKPLTPHTTSLNTTKRHHTMPARHTEDWSEDSDNLEDDYTPDNDTDTNAPTNCNETIHCIPTTHNQQSFRNSNLLCQTETLLQMLAHTWSQIHPHLHKLAQHYPRYQNGMTILLESLAKMHTPEPDFPSIKYKLAKWLNQQPLSRWRIQQQHAPTITDRLHGIGDIWSGLSDDLKDPSDQNKLLPLPGKTKVLGIGPKHKLHLQGIKYCTKDKLNTDAIEPSTHTPILIPFVFGDQQKRTLLPLTFEYQTKTYHLIARSQRTNTVPPHITCILSNFENTKVWTYDSLKNSGRVTLTTQTHIHGGKTATTSAIYARSTQTTTTLPNQIPAKRKLTFSDKPNQRMKHRKPKLTTNDHPSPSKEEPTHKIQTKGGTKRPSTRQPHMNHARPNKKHKPPPSIPTSNKNIILNLQHKQLAKILKYTNPNLKSVLKTAIQEIRKTPQYPQDKHISIDTGFIQGLTKAYNINTQIGTSITGFHPEIQYTGPHSNVPIPQIPHNHPMAAIILAGVSSTIDPNSQLTTKLIKQIKCNHKPLRILVITHKTHIPTATPAMTIKAQGLPMKFLDHRKNEWQSIRHVTNLHIHLIENQKSKRKWNTPTPTDQRVLLTWAKQNNTHITFGHHWPSQTRRTPTTTTKEITVTNILRRLRKQMEHERDQPCIDNTQHTTQTKHKHTIPNIPLRRLGKILTTHKRQKTQTRPKEHLRAVLTKLQKTENYPQDRHMSIDLTLMDIITEAFNINTHIGTSVIAFHPNVTYADTGNKHLTNHRPTNNTQPTAAIILAGVTQLNDPNINNMKKQILRIPHSNRPHRLVTITTEQLPNADHILTIKNHTPLTYLNIHTNTWEQIKHTQTLYIHQIQNTKTRNHWGRPKHQHKEQLRSWATNHKADITFSKYWPNKKITCQKRLTPTVPGTIKKYKKQLHFLKNSTTNTQNPPRTLTGTIRQMQVIHPRLPGKAPTSPNHKQAWLAAKIISAKGIPAHNRTQPPDIRRVRDIYRDNMTDWHATMQSTFPIENTEMPAQSIRTDKRTDAKLKNWRYEVETQIPSQTKIKQRRQHMGNNIRWILNMRKHINKITPNAPEHNDVFHFSHTLRAKGLFEIKHTQYWDIGCTDGLIQIILLRNDTHTLTSHHQPSHQKNHPTARQARKRTSQNSNYKNNTWERMLDARALSSPILCK
jgi:hypothetical protein